jgi:hypothetical protein
MVGLCRSPNFSSNTFIFAPPALRAFRSASLSQLLDPSQRPDRSAKPFHLFSPSVCPQPGEARVNDVVVLTCGPFARVIFRKCIVEVADPIENS